MKHLPVGIQMYGLRDLLEATPERFESVMEQIKEMGYDGVELAGLYGLAPEFVKKTLDAIGLIPISAHVPLSEMMRDIKTIVDTYKMIGCRYLVVPYLPEEYRHLTPGYETVIAEMTRIGNYVSEHGMTLLYHNHDFEFVRLADGSFGFDDIYTRVPEKALSAEPDTCWIKVAGQDPVAYLKKYRGRCPIVHLKDYIKEGNPKNLYKLIGIQSEETEEDSGVFAFRPIGCGQQIWEPILAASLEAEAKWVVVEQDEHYDLPSMECAKMSRFYLDTLGW